MDGCAGLGISPLPWRAIVQCETTKSAYLCPFTMCKCLRELVEHDAHCQVDVLLREFRKQVGESFDQFGAGHGLGKMFGSLVSRDVSWI